MWCKSYFSFVRDKSITDIAFWLGTASGHLNKSFGEGAQMGVTVESGLDLGYIETPAMGVLHCIVIHGCAANNKQFVYIRSLFCQAQCLIQIMRQKDISRQLQIRLPGEHDIQSSR